MAQNSNNSSASTEPSLFSRKLSQYISECNYSVYKMAKMTGLGRTAIQHTMSGKLVPGRDFVKTLCDVLFLTPAQRDELMQLHLRAKIGDKLYNQRRIVKKIIENASQRSSIADAYISGTFHETEIEHNINEALKNMTVRGNVNINNVLRDIILMEMQSKLPEVSFSIPFEHSAFFEMMVHITFRFKQRVRFNHYLRIFKEDNSRNENIKILENALKMSANLGAEYKPEYYYASGNIKDDAIYGFPYSLVAGNYAVLITADFQSAIISADREFHDVVKRILENMEQHSRPLVEVVNKSDNMEIFVNGGGGYPDYVNLNYQPCFAVFTDREMIEQLMPENSPDRQKTKETVCAVYSSGVERFKKKQADFSSYFMPDGLDYFVNTGILTYIPQELIKPVPVEKRIGILEKMKSSADCFHMLNPQKINIPNFLEIELSANSTLISYVFNDKVVSSLLTEPGICVAFEDFLKGLDDIDAVVKPSEMIGKIDACIERLRIVKESMMEGEETEDNEMLNIVGK